MRADRTVSASAHATVNLGNSMRSSPFVAAGKGQPTVAVTRSEPDSRDRCSPRLLGTSEGLQWLGVGQAIGFLR